MYKIYRTNKFDFHTAPLQHLSQSYSNAKIIRLVLRMWYNANTRLINGKTWIMIPEPIIQTQHGATTTLMTYRYTRLSLAEK